MLKDHLLKELNPLNLNLARLKCLALLLSSLLRHRTVNLTLLATENLTGAKNESCYRRFQNLFLKSGLCPTSISLLILAKIPQFSKGWVLSMDRTNWKYGKRHINILTVGVVLNNIAIPIVWKVLPQKTKRGNSNTSQRITLLKKLLRLMPAEDILVLTMDREFVGREWLQWLNEKGVGYVVRVKSNTVVGRRLASEHRTTKQSKSKAQLLQKIWGLDLFFSSKVILSKGRRDELLHVISNLFQGEEAPGLYNLRWGIKLLFSHLKKRGFNLEATHVTDARKREKLLALVSLAFLYSFGWGCHLRTTRKQTKATERKSLFRLGLEGIPRLLNNPHIIQDERDAFTDWLKRLFSPSNFTV